eukprot:701249-Amphidinium_carterae.1
MDHTSAVTTDQNHNQVSTPSSHANEFKSNIVYLHAPAINATKRLAARSQTPNTAGFQMRQAFKYNVLCTSPPPAAVAFALSCSHVKTR